MSVVKRFRKCADPCQHFLTPDDTHNLCVMCLGEEHMRFVHEGTECVHCERFLWKSPVLICPFTWENWGNNLETEIVGIADGVWEESREEFISRARWRLTRVNCWRRTCCHLHLLIQQEVLCQLPARVRVRAVMIRRAGVGWWGWRGYFWAFSACLPHVWRAAGSYGACYC